MSRPPSKDDGGKGVLCKKEQKNKQIRHSQQKIDQKKQKNNE
jgi:hypothetical protein